MFLMRQREDFGDMVRRGGCVTGGLHPECCAVLEVEGLMGKGRDFSIEHACG